MNLIDIIIDPNNKDILEAGDKVDICTYEEAVVLGHKSKACSDIKDIKWGRKSVTIDVVYNLHAKDKKIWYSVAENIYVYPREFLTRVK